MHGYGFPAAVALRAPDFIHQIQPRENLVRVGKQLKEQKKFLLRQDMGLVFAPYGKGIVIERDAALHDFALLLDFGPAQKRADVQQ